MNELVNEEIEHHMVIGRDHLDSGSVASPYRETEGMLDGSDAIADWALLNALINITSFMALRSKPPNLAPSPVDHLAHEVLLAGDAAEVGARVVLTHRPFVLVLEVAGAGERQGAFAVEGLAAQLVLVKPVFGRGPACRSTSAPHRRIDHALEAGEVDLARSG